MKKFFLSVVLAVMAFSAFAQSYDVTLKFLGFPVDGSKQKMIENLKSKGFSYNTLNDYLSGQFNGENVKVLIHTNHSIVDRIAVVFPSTSSRTEIKNRFNRLLRQFEENEKYYPFGKNEPIPMDEDIVYELTVNDKQYEAGFYYMGDNSFESVMNQLCEIATPKLSEEDAASFVSTVRSFLDNSDEEALAAFAVQMNLLSDAEWTSEEAEKMFNISNYLISASDTLVWFTIDNQGIDYNIILYYDNRANMANGEDL